MSDKKEQYDPKAMAFKMKQSFQNYSSAAVEQTLDIAPTTNNKKELYEGYEDVVSIKGRFSWYFIAKIPVPVITRTIGGKSYEFVSTRMVENHLLKKYLSYLNTNIYSCTSIRSHFITNSEAGLLNEINQFHCDFGYENEMFYGGIDYIVRLEDIKELYTFLNICYKTLVCNINTGRKKKCGFIRIDFESVVPYCKQDNLTFIPLFYFEGQIDDLKHRAEKVQNWNLSYLKFCCKIQGINDHYYAGDSCIMASLDEIKNCFPTDTHFKEFWPPRTYNTEFLNNSTNFSPPGSWFIKPPKVVFAIPHTLAPLAPVIQHCMPVMINTNEKKWPANKMSSAMSQESGLKNKIIHVVPSPPLGHSGNMASVMGQCMTTMYNSMTNSNMMSHSNQMQQIYHQCSINNSQDQQLELQQQHIQQQQQQQPLQIKIFPNQHSYSGHSELGRLTNTQLHNPLRNVKPIVIIPATEIVDLSSPLSSPIPPTVLETSPSLIFNLELKKIPELNEKNNRNTAAFKIQKVTLPEGTLHCINLKPYIYSNLLATLDDLVQILFPSYNVARFAYILRKKLKITLFSGNSEQLAVLRENRRFGSLYSEGTPMALLHDIANVWELLKTLLMERDQNIYLSGGESSKKRHTS